MTAKEKTHRERLDRSRMMRPSGTKERFSTARQSYDGEQLIKPAQGPRLTPAAGPEPEAGTAPSAQVTPRLDQDGVDGFRETESRLARPDQRGAAEGALKV
jgi:hypothetical protein